jgi:uncharacterized protein (TIGR02246 family)
MRATVPLIGAVLVIGAGLALAAAAGPQTAPAQPKAIATASSDKPATPAATAAPASAAAAAVPADKTLIEPLTAFVKAYNAQDAAALAALYTDDAAVVDSSGSATRGRASIAAMYAAAFSDVPGLKIEATPESVRNLTPDVAQVEGQSRLSGGAAGAAVQITRFSVLLVRQGGQWRLAELRDYPTAAEDVTPYERLRDLEWMVGDWVDESDNAKVSASVRWADNQSYLVRTYSVEIQGEPPKTGTMFIGWDPQTGQIKSWIFDSEGGHGEGLWTRAADNQWVVKAHGVLRDGRPTSATQIHTVLNKDSVKTASIDRIVGGQIAPDVPEIVMVKKPPKPEIDQPAETPKPAPASAPK